MFEIAVEHLRGVVGQQLLERLTVEGGDVVRWGAVELIQRHRFQRSVARAVVADGEFHDGLLQVPALAMHRHGPKGQATAVRLANGGEQAAMVTIREAFRADWLILEESQPHTKENAGLVRWVVQVPAKGQAVLRYRVRMK